MLFTLILWVYQFIVILPFGLFFLFFFRRKYDEQREGVPLLTIAFLLGLVILTTATSFFSLFFPINWFVQLITLLMALVLWIFLIRQRSSTKIQFPLKPNNLLQGISLVVLIAAAIEILIAAGTAPSNPDTGIYHAQAIRWIETYKAIPGLGNLHHRFAYNSSWLVINALFSFSYLKIQSFHLLPSLLALVSSIYFFEGLYKLCSGEYKLKNFVKIVFLCGTILFLQNEFSSPGTDLPVTLIIWILCSEWISQIEDSSEQFHASEIAIGIIAILCITIKLSAAAIVLLFIWVIIREFKKKRFASILVMLVSAILVLSPFIWRNIILSGQFVFPGLKKDLIQADWRIPSQVIETETDSIHWFALLPRMDQSEFNQMGWQDQYKSWFYDQLPRHKAMLLALTFAPCFAILLLPFSKWRTYIKTKQNIIWLIFVIYCGIGLWVISAPTFRFGYGFVVAALAIMVALFAVFILDLIYIPKAIIKTLGIFIVLSLYTNSGFELIKYHHVSEFLILPMDYPSWSTSECKFGNFSILCAEQYASCWYDEFPCAVNGNKNVFMRGLDFEDGFKYIP